MALEDPEPSFEERWRARIEAGVAVSITFGLLMVVQHKVLPRNVWIGLGVAPLLHFGAFQLVSRVATGRTFGIRINPRATSSDEVLDVVFTVAFLITLLVGLYTAAGL